MENKIKEIIETTKLKFGLDNYHLGQQELYRGINEFNETIYSLSMEWYPAHMMEQDEEGVNPKGTAVIQYQLDTGQYRSVIFVQGMSYANGPICSPLSLNEIIRWVERESTLVYGKQFQLSQQKDNRFQFFICVGGIPIAPSGQIEVHLDHMGKLVQYSIYGQYPPAASIQEELYSLSLHKVESFAKKQLQLIEYPAQEQQRYIPFYLMEEIYVSNDGQGILPFQFTANSPTHLTIDEVVAWDFTNIQTEPFERVDVNLSEIISVEQAVVREPHPDTFPITTEEQEKCITVVKRAMVQLYPDDSGQWVLKALQRDRGYIQAVLRKKKTTNHMFQRKLLLFIDTERSAVVNHMDNITLLHMFDPFESAEDVKVSHEEAFSKLKDLIELSPVYVYDATQKKYILCGKLDCHFGVHAVNGEVMSLDDLH
ncbi:hypothetical protein MH117_08170 [Paenibacillus sp. ACRRX]|uniref:hypothetical protein n=1 Tax=Paenibacillus sp. ACRRX TaxID=2918206 RepID=UPI001EF73BBB|nr:hypothetical protein [Paenibacillus sp. ACRRX]MCG7407394.1 hypothetical protein [Paenibacillus sp. ACRRX]